MSTYNNVLGLAEPRVSFLEQAAPRCYVRSLYCFRLLSGDQQAVSLILREALEATFAAIPVLKAQLVPVDDDGQQGKHDLKPGGNEELFVRDLTSSCPDYEHLCAKGFPISSFEDETFWATPCFPSLGEKITVFVAQANFITGGLLLGISFWHLVMDSPALGTALRVLACHCSRIQEPNIHVDTNIILSSIAFEKSRLHESPSKYTGLLSDHPEYVLFPSVPTSLPSFMTTPLAVEIFHISPASLKLLKAAATPVIKFPAHENERLWVSTNDAITALIWRSIIAATYGDTSFSDSPPSCCQIAVNARPRLSPPLPTDYFGCALTFATNDLPISSILDPTSFPTMALMIRQSSNKVTAPYIQSVMAMMRNVPDFRRFVPRSISADLLGRDTVMTSWASLPLYEYEWGPIFGGKCERVRAPKGGIFNGLQTVLPALPERLGGGCEVMVGLEREVMERLKGNKIWRQFCRPLEG